MTGVMEAALAAEAAAGAVLEEGEAPARSLARETSGARTRHPVSRAAIDAMATKDMQEMFDVFDDDQGGTVEGSEFARHLNDSLSFALDQDGVLVAEAWVSIPIHDSFHGGTQ